MTAAVRGHIYLSCMYMNDSFKKTVLIILLILLIPFIFVCKLFQNIASEPFSFERMFSIENIKETSVTLLIIAILVIPVKFLWDKHKQKYDK